MFILLFKLVYFTFTKPSVLKIFKKRRLISVLKGARKQLKS